MVNSEEQSFCVAQFTLHRSGVKQCTITHMMQLVMQPLLSAACNGKSRQLFFYCLFCFKKIPR